MGLLLSIPPIPSRCRELYIPRNSRSARTQLSNSLPPLPDFQISYARLAIISCVIWPRGVVGVVGFGIAEPRIGVVAILVADDTPVVIFGPAGVIPIFVIFLAI